jgi:hypothetical protein
MDILIGASWIVDGAKGIGVGAEPMMVGAVEVQA